MTQQWEFTRKPRSAIFKIYCVSVTCGVPDKSANVWSWLSQKLCKYPILMLCSCMKHKWKFLEAHTIGFLSWLHLMKSSERCPMSLASASPGKDGSWFLNTACSRVLCPCQTLAAFALWMAQRTKHYSQSMYIDNPKLSSNWLDILNSGLTFILRTKITITRLAWPNWQSHTWFPRPVNLIMIPRGEAL